MSYNPVIASARRAAKQISRETGTPYQSSLDAVARQAGRDDWDAYLASPVQVPDMSGQSGAKQDGLHQSKGLYIEGAEHAHNMNSLLLTGAATTPSLLALGLMLSPSQSLISSDLQLNTTMAMPIILGIALWAFATMMALTLFNMMAVHPDVPEIGRDGTRQRFNSVELARFSMGMGALAWVGGFLTRGVLAARLDMVTGATALAIVAGVAALMIRVPLARRILALASANGALSAVFITIGAVIR
jgi:hypothetical protein